MPMEDKQVANPTNSLRPHHALCALFFEGKGYSQPFIENMTAFLAEPNQKLRISMGCDILCQECPHNQDGICDDEEKVARFDHQTVILCGDTFQTDQPQSLSNLCPSVYEDILQKGRLAEVCGECEWAALCQGKWQRGDYNRSLLQPFTTSGQAN